ncbi:MFS transporter [Megalodesulfovibrio gigas]|uniref:Putative major facilitator superfamily protein n=1 Tax=Megalodesulfovibrio gigas (strain ATCC 19364 / DSM 1382 / NCIMB 9332 / VKM B-1759) TaxID=1121448 RepID=T2G828_MEGG1|nr:MFS transporter [Megalodesulfovibrio gigas]AGW12735.1 putative major facilitator superfamily protein [Megalodesulfovibrio gigas DSM 1382 = ATCC 19364]
MPVESSSASAPSGTPQGPSFAAAPRSLRELLKDPTLRIVFGVTCMMVMGVTSIAPAFPRIIAAFDIPAASIGLLLTWFTVPGVILTPVMGILADRYGRRQVLAPSLALFGVAGVACTFADSFETLCLLRLFQGMGAAALGALNITIIGDAFEGRERITALGLNASVLSIGVASYPILGGALAQLHWRLPFLLPLAALPVAWWVWRRLKLHVQPGGMDAKAYFRSAWDAMKGREVLTVFAVTACTFVLIYGPFLSFVPVHLGKDLHAEPWQIGVLLSSAALLTVLFTTQIGRISARIGVTTCIKAAFVIYAVANLVFFLSPALWWHVVPIMLFGMGQGLNIPSTQALMAEYAPPGNRGGFMAMNGTLLRLGQTIGPLLFGGFFALGGMDAVFLGGVVVALGMFAVALRGFRRTPA